MTRGVHGSILIDFEWKNNSIQIIYLLQFGYDRFNVTPVHSKANGTALHRKFKVRH